MQLTDASLSQHLGIVQQPSGFSHSQFSLLLDPLTLISMQSIQISYVTAIPSIQSLQDISNQATVWHTVITYA